MTVHTAEFTTEYGIFFKTLKDRCKCDLWNYIEPKVVLKQASDIVKYGHYTMLAAAAGTLLHSGFGAIVGLSFVFFQAIRLNFAGLGLNTKLSDWEEVIKIVALVTASFVFATWCSKKGNQTTRHLKTTRHSSEADHVQAERKKNEEEPLVKPSQRKKGGH